MRLYLVLGAAAALASPAAAQHVKLTVPLKTLEARAVADSNDPIAHYDLAHGRDEGLWDVDYEKANADQRARLDWSDSLTRGPGDPVLMSQLGMTLALDGHVPEADRTLAKAMAENPRNPRIPCERGMLAVQIGDTRTARECLERFVALAPSKFKRQVEQAKSRLATLQ